MDTCFNRFYTRLCLFAMLRAFFAAFCIALTGNAALALVVYSTKGLNALWIAPVGGAVLLLITAPLFYFKRYRPNKQAIARQVDNLGLDERAITMVEFENDESEMAQLQREDTLARMKTANHKGLRYAMPISMIVLVAVFALFSAGTTVLAGLSISGQVPSAYDFLEGRYADELRSQLYSVSYVVEEGGVIEGEADQLVAFGGATTTVVAVADDGWMFQGWDDGGVDPARSEKDVINDIVLTAVFVRAEPNEDSEGGSGGGEGEPNDEPQEPQDPGEGNGANGERVQLNNQVIDGETYYRDVLENFYAGAMEKLANGESIPDDVRAMVEAYYKIIT